MKKTNVLITGASGFIGKSLVRVLNEKFNCLLILRNKKTKFDKKFKCLYSDLSNFDKIKKKIIRFNPEICVHLAWQGIPTFDTENSLTNINATINFLNFIIEKTNCNKIITSGTCLEYSKKNGLCIEKNKETMPNSTFVWSKKIIYDWLYLKSKEKKFDLVWLRIFYVYGPNQREGSLIPSIIKNIKAKNKILLKTPYEFKDYIHVDDVSLCISKAILRKKINGIYNVGTGETYCPIEINNMIASHLSSDKFLKKINKIKYNQYKDKFNLRASISKTSIKLNWRPKKNMSEEIVKLI